MSNTEETKSEAQTVAMDAEAAAQIGAKRKVEEEAVPESAGGEGDAQPPAKAQKTDADDAAATKQAAPAQEPVTIGYKTFETGKQAYDYFHKLMKDLRKYQNLNDVRGAGMVQQGLVTGVPCDGRVQAPTAPLLHCRLTLACTACSMSIIWCTSLSRRATLMQHARCASKLPDARPACC